MIVYGEKSKEILSESLPDKCSNCGAENSLKMHVFQKYAHVFSLPSFPTGKTAETECSNCKQVIKLEEMTDSFKEEYKRLKSKSNTSVYYYSWLIAVAIVIIFIILANGKSGNKNADLIETAQIGDVYQIKTPEHQYTLIKVEKVVGDSVYFLENQFESNNLDGLKEIEKKWDSSYLPQLKSFTKFQLLSALKRKKIIEIERK